MSLPLTGALGAASPLLKSAAAGFSFGGAALFVVEPPLTEDGGLLTAVTLAAGRSSSTGVGVVMALVHLSPHFSGKGFPPRFHGDGAFGQSWNEVAMVSGDHNGGLFCSECCHFWSVSGHPSTMDLHGSPGCSCPCGLLIH